MKTILLVDDEPDFLKVIKVRLEANGYKVITAADGQEGLKIVKSQSLDLIIMDIMMPKMDGIKAVAFIKADTRYQTIPILMLTASAAPGDRQECEKIGASDFCNKPINVDELLKKIAKLI